MTDRRVDIVARAIADTRWDALLKEQAVAVLAALDADLADPDTRQRMMHGSCAHRSFASGFDLGAALAAWRGEP